MAEEADGVVNRPVQRECAMSAVVPDVEDPHALETSSETVDGPS